jgi:hypothetical protein
MSSSLVVCVLSLVLAACSDEEASSPEMPDAHDVLELEETEDSLPELSDAEDSSS